MKSANPKNSRRRGRPRRRAGQTGAGPPRADSPEVIAAIEQAVRDLRAELNRLDRRQIKSAQERQAAGQSLSKADSGLLRRFKDITEELMFWEYCRRLPNRVYRLLSGRQSKVLLEQSERHGLPVAGASLDLLAIIRAFHDLLSRHRHRLLTEDPDETLMKSGEGPTLERWRLAKAQLAELDVQERIGNLADMDAVRFGFGILANILRGVGEKLQRHFGEGAADIFNNGIEDFQRAAEAQFEGPQPFEIARPVPLPDFEASKTPNPITIDPATSRSRPSHPGP